MDIIRYFKKQTLLWDAENKCGLCWRYDAPLDIATLNKHEKEDYLCCVHVFVTDLNIRQNRNYAGTGLMNDFTEEYSFTLHILKPSEIGLNVYQEQLHPISESLWATILEPIKNCLSSANPFSFCDILNRDIRIGNITWNSKINYLDENYSGWSLSITLRDDEPTSTTASNYVLDLKVNDEWNGTLLFTHQASGETHSAEVVDGKGIKMIGSKSGTYNVSITAGTGTLETSTVEVQNEDRIELIINAV